MPSQIVEARWTWIGGRFRPHVQIEIAPDGRIAAVGPLAKPVTHPLAHHAVLPGLVSAHSHAFQRGLRGHGERFPGGAGSFWSWREAMYRLVERLDAHEFAAWCRRAFREMLDEGITTVGEFHYVHHDRRHQDFGFDALVLEAAAAAGIRITLLNTYYRTGGIGQPLGPAQRRFDGVGLETFWRQMDRLTASLDPATQTLGVAAHSVRAVPLEELAALHRETTARGWRFHVHVEEQRREIEECVAAYGSPPMALLLDTVDGLANVTAVHCTHTRPSDLDRFVDAGGSVCVCPLTEANLGDGLPRLGRAATLPGALCIGTDSNARISGIEEMRWLEYGQRLRGESRGVLVDASGNAAARLLDIATAGGAAALGLETGAIAAGLHADLAVVDLDAPGLAEAGGEELLDALAFGAGGDAVVKTCVGGRWRERGTP